MAPQVVLAPGELAVATMLGTMRQTVNASVGVKERRFSKDPLAIHVRGAQAEIAFAKLVWQFPDLTTDPRGHTYDFLVNGKTVDVKGVAKHNDRLLTRVGKRLADADIYVVGVVEGDRVTFKGWASATDLINPDAVRDIGYGPTYILNDDQLSHDWSWAQPCTSLSGTCSSCGSSTN